MKKNTFLTSLLIGLFLSLSITAQTTVNFNSGTGLVHNTDFSSNIVTVGNFKFTYNQATWFGTNNGNLGTMALEAITISNASGQSQSITIETIDESEFDFQSFWLDVLSFDGNENWTLEGFKDWGSVGSQVITVTGDSTNGYAQTVIPNSTFDNVDKVTITAGATGFFYYDIFDDFVFGTAVSNNTAPTLNYNRGSTLLEGGRDLITRSELNFKDAEEADTHITFTLHDLPDNGILRRNTLALNLGSTFTQDDINNNRIDYLHDDSETNSDSFRVDVSDGQGGTLVEQTFNFTIIPVDDTPPIFEGGTPSATSISQTQFSLNAGINEAGTIYYVVVFDGATAPSAAEVKAGTATGGIGQIKNGNSRVTSASGFTNIFVISGLTASTSYDVYVIAEDDKSRPNLQIAPTKIDVTMEAETTPPIFEGGTPSATSISRTQFSLKTDINEAGFIYYVLFVDGAPAPSSSEVKAGLGAGGTIPVKSGFAPAGGVSFENTFIMSGLTAGTAYDVYVVAEDDEPSRNLQIVPTKIDVTTASLISLTVSGITGYNKVYNGSTAATISGTEILSGVIPGDDVSLDGIPVFTFASANIGTGIPIYGSGYTLSGADSEKYTLTQPTLSGDITAAPLTVTAIDQTKVYGATDSALAYTISGFVNGDTEASLDTGVSISRAAGENVDTYTITPSGAAKSNYTISFVTADFSITAAPLTVTALDQTKVYGATDPALAYTITGFVNGDTEASLDTGVSISRTAGENVDTYTIIPSGAAKSNYTISFVTADFSITAAPLTVTALDQTKVYSATDPVLTYTITGFVNGDTEASLDTGVSISRTVGENVGTYTITPSGAAKSNYTISFITADFSITPASLTVTALDQTKIYGTTDPVFTYTITGFVNGDTETNLDTPVSISRNIGENVGKYTITPSAASSSNYTVSFETSELGITAAGLIVSAIADQSKAYGAIDPALTYTITGFVNGDTEANLATPVSISRNIGENVGTYTITPSGASSSNYTISFVTADFSITAAPLTVTALDQTKVYSATDPVLTYTITGFVNGDTEASLDTGVNISRTAGENVETYTITPSGASSSNYTISFVAANFSITAAPLTVTALDQTKVYNATDPVLTYTITGFVNGDTEASLDTGVSISRTLGENVDMYTITPSGAVKSNYTISFITADFSITPASLTVTALDQTKIYGTTDPVFTYTITGFVNGDTEINLDTPVSISRNTGENVGKYTITPSAASSSNYTVSFEASELGITAAGLIVSAIADQSKVYGAIDPALTYTITGFVNGDTEANLDTGVSIARAAGETVAAYTITPSGASDSNYDVSFVTADFSITAAELTITGLTGNNKVYDGTTNATTIGIPVLSGAVSGDDVVLEGTPVFTFESADLGTDIQIITTGFIITGTDSGNYTLAQPTLFANILTTLGVENIADEKLSLKLYPNPSTNYIRVQGLSDKANYIIYNLLGKEVGKGNVKNEEGIKIQDLNNGTYFIRIENAKAIKFIKM